MLLPAIMFCTSLYIVTPDLETWLATQTRGFARLDAFDGVTRISPSFAGLFGITSLFAAYLVVLHKSQFLVALAAGPLLAALVYLIDHGVADPAWFTLLPLLSIGMLVGWLRSHCHMGSDERKTQGIAGFLDLGQPTLEH